MTDTITKHCASCAVEKELTEFSVDVRRRHGVRSHCKSCEKARRRANRAKKVLARAEKIEMATPVKDTDFSSDKLPSPPFGGGHRFKEDLDCEFCETAWEIHRLEPTYCRGNFPNRKYMRPGEIQRVGLDRVLR